MEGTFHRRDLKPPSISFSSPEGRTLFNSSLASGHLEVYFLLAEHFQTQGHPSFCGVGSLTMVLNSFLLDPRRGVWRWFDESMLDCCESHDVIKLKGITLSKLACLARCNGAAVTLKFASSIEIDEFRTDVIETSNGSRPVQTAMIVSYSRGTLNQSGSGHFSPIGGYDPVSDRVLIMDVARFKYPPHWVPLPLLFEAMCQVDKDSGRSRGYLLLQASSSLETRCSDLCCPDPCEPRTEDETPSDFQPHDSPPDPSPQEKLKCLLAHSCLECSPTNSHTH